MLASQNYSEFCSYCWLLSTVLKEKVSIDVWFIAFKFEIGQECVIDCTAFYIKNRIYVYILTKLLRAILSIPRNIYPNICLDRETTDICMNICIAIKLISLPLCYP